MTKPDLRYVGGGRFMVGVPDVDMTPDELEAAAVRLNMTPATLREQLLASDLYTEAKPKRSLSIGSEADLRRAGVDLESEDVIIAENVYVELNESRKTETKPAEG